MCASACVRQCVSVWVCVCACDPTLPYTITKHLVEIKLKLIRITFPALLSQSVVIMLKQQGGYIWFKYVPPYCS